MDQDQPTDQLQNYRQQYSYFAKRLLSDLQLGDLAEPERGQLLASIEAHVQQILTNTLLENLRDDQLDGAEAIADGGGSQEELVIYLLETIPEVEMKIADALAAAYAQLLDESRQLAQAIGRSYDAAETTNESNPGLESITSVNVTTDTGPIS